MSKAILLSGGIDSISLAYWHRPPMAFTIDYGQASAKTEIRVSRTITQLLNIEHYVITVDCHELGIGDLVNGKSISASPSTEWWPYRNQLLITLGCMRGIGLGISELMLASVKTDNFHKDGTDDFYKYANQLVQYQEGNIHVSSPCINLTTVELVRLTNIPKSILMWAHSCHTADIACGKCRGCNKYLKVMTELRFI